MTISIYGVSDACVIVDGCEGGDEHYSYERGARRARWRGDLVAPDGQTMRVYAIFDGCWHFSIGQAGQAVPIPLWPHAITQHPTVTYSALLEVQAPPGTRLAEVWPASETAGETRRPRRAGTGADAGAVDGMVVTPR